MTLYGQRTGVQKGREGKTKKDEDTKNNVGSRPMLTMATIAFILWSCAVLWNGLEAFRTYKQDPGFALGFALAAFLLALSVYLDFFTRLAFPTVAGFFAMGTAFGLLVAVAVDMLLKENIVWSHHALRAAIYAAIWTVWLAV
ncbi:MAG: hypothetical protein ACRCYY_19600 [Trueperaceae bacterium]